VLQYAFSVGDSEDDVLLSLMQKGGRGENEEKMTIGFTILKVRPVNLSPPNPHTSFPLPSLISPSYRCPSISVEIRPQSTTPRVLNTPLCHKYSLSL